MRRGERGRTLVRPFAVFVPWVRLPPTEYALLVAVGTPLSAVVLAAAGRSASGRRLRLGRPVSAALLGHVVGAGLAYGVAIEARESRVGARRPSRAGDLFLASLDTVVVLVLAVVVGVGLASSETPAGRGDGRPPASPLAG